MSSTRATPEAGPTATLGVVGCGYVVDLYLGRLGEHPGLTVVGVTDRRPERARRVAERYSLPVYASYEELLADPAVDIVVNLTNPREHAAVSRQALEAGKHVYSEKPLATDWDDATGLVALAERTGRRIAGAPSTHLGEAAQTAWRAVRNGAVGAPLVAYAEIDDGLVHREATSTWTSASGATWPAQDEFEVGCTMEHAAYYVTWLVAMFGPVESVTAFSSAQIPDKLPGVRLEPPATPDLSVGCLRFASGMVARVTCSIIANHDHSLRVVGPDGTLTVEEAWDFGSPVRLARWNRFRFRADRHPALARTVGMGARRLRLARKVEMDRSVGGNRIDFLRGVSELAAAIASGERGRMPSDFCLHVNEIVLTLQHPELMGSPRTLETTTEPIEPMPWAADR